MTTFTKPSLHIAADDFGKSKQPALSPIFKKVAPLLVTPFQKAMKSVGSPAKKKVFKTYFSKVNLGDKPMSPKNKKMLKDILVDALRQDRGWLEFVAEQILDGSSSELADILGGDATKASKEKASKQPTKEVAKAKKPKAKKANFQVLAAEDATGAMVSAVCLALDDAARFLGESAAVHGEREDTTELVSLVDDIDHLLEVFVGFAEGELDSYYTGVRMYPSDKADAAAMARSGKNALKDIEILRRDHQIPETLVSKIEALESGIEGVLGESTTTAAADDDAISAWIAESPKNAKKVADILYKHKHRDFRGRFPDGTRSINVMGPKGGTELWPIDGASVENLLYALNKDTRAKAEVSALVEKAKPKTASPALDTILDGISDGKLPTEADIEKLGLTYPYTVDTALADRDWNVPALLKRAKESRFEVDGGKILVDDVGDLEYLFSRMQDIANDRTKEAERAATRDGKMDEVEDYIFEEDPYGPAKVLALCLEKVGPKESKVASPQLDAVYNGSYPDISEIKAMKLDYPWLLPLQGQSDTWARLGKVARRLLLVDATQIALKSDQDVADLFDALGTESDKHSEEMDRLMGEDPDVDEDSAYNEYHADDHEPAAILLSDLLTGVKSATSEEDMKTADAADGIYEGKYPELDDVESWELDYPVTLDISAGSEALDDLRVVASEEGVLSGNDIVFESEDEVYNLFQALSTKADEAGKESEKTLMDDANHYAEDEGKTPEEWFDENYNEYMSDTHEPAAVLAGLLGV